MKKVFSKRIAKMISDIMIVFHFFISVISFSFLWIEFRYGSLVNFQITKSSRYDLYIVIIFVLLLFIFSKIYNSYLLGYTRIRYLALYQFISQIFSLIIVFILVFLAWFTIKFVNLIYIVLFYFGFDCIWSYLANFVFLKTNGKRRAVVLYGNHCNKNINFDIKGKPIQCLIQIEDSLPCSMENITSIIPKLETYDILFTENLSSDCINLLAVYCNNSKKELFFNPNVGDILISNSNHIQSIHKPILHFKKRENNYFFLFVKRLFDIIFSFLGLIISSPIMLIIAIIIKAYDGGYVIYKQKRLTKNDKIFELYKFRSMIVDAEKSGKAVLSTGIKDTRITPIGKFIRATRIDELPQLVNILKGDMTIVGPRPERPEIAEQYYKTLPEYKLRLQVKAGLTGYAQVYGKYNSDPLDKLKFDLFYIYHMNVFFDIRLLFATFGILFSKESTEGVAEGQTTAMDYGISADSTGKDTDMVAK